MIYQRTPRVLVEGDSWIAGLWEATADFLSFGTISNYIDNQVQQSMPTSGSSSVTNTGDRCESLGVVELDSPLYSGVAWDEPCELEPYDWNYCSVCGPCTQYQGDCDSDDECEGILVCAHNGSLDYGQSFTLDVCEQPVWTPPVVIGAP